MVFGFGRSTTNPEVSQKETLDKFRCIVNDVLQESHDDEFLLRWLRARDFDLKNAETMLRNFLIWYDQHIKPNDYIPSNQIQINFHYKILGQDSENRHVLWLPIGKWELRKLLEAGLYNEIKLFQYSALKYLEQIVEENRKKTGIGTLVIVGDSDGLNWSKIMHYETLQTIAEFFREYEAYFPEYLHAAYFVNCPKVFSYLFHLVKPLLSSKTLAKATLYDCNKVKWEQELLKYIPKQILPIECGGDGKSGMEI